MHDATVQVFTFKQGLLSRLAHDLRLTLHQFVLELSARTLRGSFALDSLRVDGAMRRGQLSASALSERDRSEIERTMAQHVLRTATHPVALFEGELGDERQGHFPIEGQLVLAGRSQPLSARATLRSRIHCEVELVPSRWGIAPYRALGGALQLQDRVRVALDLDASGLDPQRLTALRSWGKRAVSRGEEHDACKEPK